MYIFNNLIRNKYILMMLPIEMLYTCNLYIVHLYTVHFTVYIVQCTV